MADDDEDVSGAPGREDLFGPPGPRRSNFTPAPTDAESLEAANSVFGDDAIAAALAAELARVASGPIPVQSPMPAAVVADPEPEPVAPAPVASLPQPTPAPEPVASFTAPQPEPVAMPEPVAVAEPVPEPEPEPAPEPEPEPAPAAPQWTTPEPAPAAPQPEPAIEPLSPQPEAVPLAPEPQPVVPDLPVPAPADPVPAEPEPAPVVQEASPAAPQAVDGPPDWASSLFGQPTPTVSSDAPTPVRDPFAPSEPSFAPSSGPFPPPSEADAGSSLTTDAEALRALYRGAPAPTVPPADAPPPPGYESSAPQTFVPAPQADAQPAAPDQIGELQQELHLQEQEAREFAVWESSMLAIGTPETLAEVARARQELSSAPTPAAVPSAPVAPAAEFASPEAAQAEAAQTEPQQAEAVQPEAVQPEQVQPEPAQPEQVQPEPVQPAVPAAQSFFAPPTETASQFPTLEPPTTEFATPDFGPNEPPTTDFAPTEPSQSMFAPVSFAPAEPAPVEPAPAQPPVAEAAPVEPAPAEPAPVEPVPADFVATDFSTTDSATPDFATMAPAPEWGVQPQAAEPEWEFPSQPPVDSPFPGFAPPTSEEPAPMYEAPADPRDLTFDQVPVVPDAPIFIEPPALVEPIQPTPSDGVADLYRSAGEFPPPVDSSLPDPVQQQSQAPVAPVDQSPVEPAVVEPQPAQPAPVPSLWEVAQAETAAAAQPPVPEQLPPLNPLVPPAAAAQPVAPPPPPPVTFGGFDPAIDGGQISGSPLPAPVWSAPAPEPEAPKDDDEPGGHRPFGEGVERDDAVDPSDSIFGAAALPVSVNTAGVAVVAQPVSLESTPIRVIAPEPPPEQELVPPPVLPAEPIGLEPTPLDQRVGRSARLFWLWFAANSSIVAIVFGAIIFALGVSLRQAIVATLAGVALSFLPLGLGTLAGKRSGQPTMVISRASFGVVGNILPALIALLSRLLWAAALLWILGGAVADILTGAKLNDGFTSQQLTLVTMALGFLVAVALAYFGYALISIVQLIISIVSGLAIIGFIALTVQYVNIQKALAVGDGPWILVVTGAVLVFSFVGLAWANSGADVARYQRTGSRGSAAMLWATFGAGLPTFVLICYGALLAASNPTLAHNIELDPLDSLGRLLPVWYPAPLIAATGLSLLSGVVLAMYSGGFALQAAGLRLRRPLATLLVGVLVVLIAAFLALTVTDYVQLVRDLATTVAVPIAAWAGIFGSELMIRNRRFHAPSLLSRGGVYADARWGNLLALVVASIIGLGFLSATLPGLTWEGYLFTPLGIPLSGVVAQSDFGVLVALVLGILFPLVAGIPGIRKQEKAEATPE